MAPLATLSIDLEGTVIGLRPTSQGTNQILPGYAQRYSDVCIRTSISCEPVGESQSTRGIGRLAHEVAIEDDHKG